MSGVEATGTRGARSSKPSGGGREYRVDRGTLRFTYGYLIFLTAITVFGLVFAPPRVLFAVLLMYLIWRWYELLRTPTRIRLRDEGAVELRSRLGTQVLNPGEIKLIRRRWRGYWLQHDKGAVALFGGLEGFDGLVADLRAANPNIRVEGWATDASGGRG